MSISRRNLITLASGGIGYLALARLTEGAAFASGPMGPTVLENLQPGSTSWSLTKPALQREIEGYASLTSVNRGGEIKLFVHTAESSYTFSVYRMGWYGGVGARLMLGPISRPGVSQPMPAPDPITGLTECNWTNPYTLTIPYDASDPTVWASGVYLAKLTAGTTGAQSYIMFVVRDDQRVSDFLFQSSATSFQAYNNWGGKRLYNHLSSGGVRASKVSFNRPYARIADPAYAGGMGAAEFLIGGDGGPPAGWEYSMVRFLERQGFDVSYCTNLDVHANPNLLLSHKGFLSVGHDEYWSREMRQNVTAARDRGVSLGFFTANTCYWQVRLEPSVTSGAQNRTLVCYKYTPVEGQGSNTKDPYYLDGNSQNDHLITARWRDSLPNSTRVPEPEETLIGVQYEFGDDRVDAALVVQNTGHWVFAGTGLKDGDKLPGLVGHETDTMHGNSPPGTVLLGRSPHTGNTYFTNGSSDMTIYQAPSGALVYAASSFQFMWGFDDWGAPLLRTSRLNPAAHQMAMNILTAFTKTQITGSNLPVARPGGPYRVPAGAVVQFDGSASFAVSGGLTTYEWDFGDGATALGPTAFHTYAENGEYLVRLTVTDDQGRQDSGLTNASVVPLVRSASADSTWNTTWQGKIFCYPASGLHDGIVPVPTQTDLFKQWFSAGSRPMDTQGVLTAPINVYFTFNWRAAITQVRLYNGSYESPGQFHSKAFRLYLRTSGSSWTLIGSGTLANANGAPLQLNVPSFAADEARIEILSTYDLTNKAVGLAEVLFGTTEKPLNVAPIARPGGPYYVKVGKPTTFDGAKSTDADGSIVSYKWDFGDGTSATGVRVNRTYTKLGVYTLTLTVTDNAGETGTAQTTVEVLEDNRYRKVDADSVFDSTYQGTRYYYPAKGVGDYIVPAPAQADMYKQWFAAGNRPMDAKGVLTTPINVSMIFWARQNVARARITQASYVDGKSFHTQKFALYLRRTGQAWTLVVSGVLPDRNRQAVDLFFNAVSADEARIVVQSSWDNDTNRSVGLAEVELFTGQETDRPAVVRANGPYTGKPSVAIQFTGSATPVSGTTITAWEWDFGDGTTGIGQTPLHAYADSGTYVACLTVTDSRGRKSTASALVTVAS